MIGPLIEIEDVASVQERLQDPPMPTFVLPPPFVSGRQAQRSICHEQPSEPTCNMNERDTSRIHNCCLRSNVIVMSTF